MKLDPKIRSLLDALEDNFKEESGREYERAQRLPLKTLKRAQALGVCHGYQRAIQTIQFVREGGEL